MYMENIVNREILYKCAILWLKIRDMHGINTEMHKIDFIKNVY